MGFIIDEVAVGFRGAVVLVGLGGGAIGVEVVMVLAGLVTNLIIGNLGVVDFDVFACILEALDGVDVEVEFVIILMGFIIDEIAVKFRGAVVLVGLGGGAIGVEVVIVLAGLVTNLIIGNLVGVVDFDAFACALEALDGVDVEVEFVIILVGFIIDEVAVGFRGVMVLCFCGGAIGVEVVMVLVCFCGRAIGVDVVMVLVGFVTNLIIGNAVGVVDFDVLAGVLEALDGVEIEVVIVLVGFMIDEVICVMALAGFGGEVIGVEVVVVLVGFVTNLITGNLVGVVDFDGLADVLEALDDVDVEFEFVIVLMGFDVPV
ncbi:21599_t:CDS:1 [Entrophospora sp. SA101]|nr:21599_t:CDS:1 [Entrophospora sp. SA101]